MQVQKDELTRAQAAEARLKQENSALQGEIARLQIAIVDLLRRDERYASPTATSWPPHHRLATERPFFTRRSSYQRSRRYAH